MEQVEQVFNVIQYEESKQNDSDEDGGAGFRFNEYEVRDAFLEFMQSLMFGYTKYLVRPKI